MELAVIKYNTPVRMMTTEELQVIITDIEREQEEMKKSAQDSNVMET